MDDKGNEIVYTGCGLCFQKKTGDEIDESKIEKTFVMEKPSEQFKQLVSEMPYEQIARVLETSEGALKASYHHAYEKVKTWVKEEMDAKY